MMLTRKWMLAAGAIVLCASVLTLSTIAAGPPKATVTKAPIVERGVANIVQEEKAPAISEMPVGSLVPNAVMPPAAQAGTLERIDEPAAAEMPTQLGEANTSLVVEKAPVVEGANADTPRIAQVGNLTADVEQSSIKMTSTNQGGLVAYVGPTPFDPNPAYGSRAVGYDGSPGTEAPPPLLGGFPMTPFPADPRPLGDSVSDIPVPAESGCDGAIGLVPNMDHRMIGSGWATWSHGYTGDVYTAYSHPGDLVMTMPPNTCAVYFYVEPNTFTPAFAVECIANQGLATEVSSGTVMVLGDSGATYFGFFASSPDHVETVTVIVDAAANGFAVGEFGITCGADCVTEPVACCDDTIPSCVDQVPIVDCMAQGGRFELGVQFCADLVPPCGALEGACCCGPLGEAGVCDPYECIGDMFASDCLAMGEETSWYPDETCAGVIPFECNAPTYCDASGGCDEYITGVQIGDINNTGTPCDGYADYTDLFTYLLYGVDYDITVTNGNYWSTDITTVWIDWNQDKDFADADEMVSSGDPGGAIYTDVIGVAAGAPAGPTRMRIRIQYGGTPDPCGATTYGEVEDYTVIIGDPPPYGACCIEETCLWSETMDEATCLAQGGIYQGDGTDCDPNPCVGACCDEVTGDCTVVVEADCLGVYQGDGTDCDPNPCPQPPPECPPAPAGYETVYTANPYLPEDPWTFGVSDDGFPYIRYENFTGVNNDICWLTFWGGELTGTFGNCTRDPNEFRIVFYPDNGAGQPDLGTELCSYVVTPDSREFTGYTYHPTYAVMLWEYQVELPSCCSVPPDAWFSLQGINDSGADCRFWWVSSPTGDQYHCGGASSPEDCGVSNNFDFAWCAAGVYIPEWGACCFDEVECGDFDNNGVVDGADYYALAGHMSTCAGDPGWDAKFDLDLDGCVTLVDYQWWLECYQGIRVDAYCEDGVEKALCFEQGGRFAADTLCADLDPSCGYWGACCYDDVAGGHCVEDYQANCTGRFILGGTCDPDPFDPPCGEWEPAKVLYAPTEADNPTFRAEVAAVVGDDCDYYDARIGTPTLAELLEYKAVLTWGNYAYADAVGMGDVLADFVDVGGRVILGQWTYHTTQVNWLEGRIMEPDYCPITATGYSTSTKTYAGDGIMCPHFGVTSYASSYTDQCTAAGGAMTDGTFTDGWLSTAFDPAMRVFYSPGNTGATFSTGEWGLLTGNIVNCSPGPLYGACCDPATGICEDNVEVLDCIPNQWTMDTLCADLPVPCGNPGACCDIYTADCTDDVLELDCDFARFEPGEQCAELNPECGTPGCCCENEDGVTPVDPFESLEANCDGRFLPGVTGAACEGMAFEPECGLWTCEGILYAPSNPDNSTFRAEVAAITGQPCDYWDTSGSIPTLEQLEGYCCVMTWGNYAYADAVGFGDNLAAYVDGGGKVILGQWTYHTTQVNWLEGAIMGPAYCPVTGSSYTFGADYQGDGMDCVHILGPVTAYHGDYVDVVTAIAGAISDGTFDFAGDAVAWRADRKVYYNAGNTGNSFSTGQWAQLTANMCECTDAALLGACCDPTTGTCTDDVPAADCAFDFHFDQACADLDPPCGNFGCCCDDFTSSTPYEEYEANCPGRHLGGVTGAECATAAFDPPCGEYLVCQHSITMWDDWGDGWNGGFIDVYVDGDLALAGVTLASGSGPETVYFDAATGATITTVWTAGGWPYEASYCIYDVNSAELGCDGMGGVDPVGITVNGNCEPPLKRPKRPALKDSGVLGGVQAKAFQR